LPTGNANENGEISACDTKRGPFHPPRSIVRVCSDLQHRPVHINVLVSLHLNKNVDVDVQ
jgi:hypothetical protein